MATSRLPPRAVYRLLAVPLRQLKQTTQRRALTKTALRLEATATVPKSSASSARIPQKTEGSTPIELIPQAPNRKEVWSRNQRPRSEAMTGPRFEQTDFGLQPQPYAAIDLVHREKVSWTHSRIVACEGGGGPAGHPKIFINTDKPEIAVCNYCGLPFANETHRKHLEALPETSYPL